MSPTPIFWYPLALVCLFTQFSVGMSVGNVIATLRENWGITKFYVPSLGILDTSAVIVRDFIRLSWAVEFVQRT